MNYRDLNDYELVSKVAENEEITDILFEKYMPLIRNVVKRLYDENQNSGLDFNDLVQEGMIGFSKAINTYNEHKDTLFFTYARKCIEHGIITSIINANRKKHSVLNNSLSMEAPNKDEDDSIEKFISDKMSDPEAILLDFENVNILTKNLKQELTSFEEQVFDLRKSGFTYREIAEVLNVEPKRVDNALQRMKNKVKEYIENNKHN
ncbi:MAG: sigma-70 family RNA polymerase sigma factor [Bacilli bacterium]|nr:sigma-70 family RNA polymerase sigma factor [Bacilli bacterium]